MHTASTPLPPLLPLILTNSSPTLTPTPRRSGAEGSDEEAYDSLQRDGLEVAGLQVTGMALGEWALGGAAGNTGLGAGMGGVGGMGNGREARESHGGLSSTTGSPMPCHHKGFVAAAADEGEDFGAQIAGVGFGGMAVVSGGGSRAVGGSVCAGDVSFGAVLPGRGPRRGEEREVLALVGDLSPADAAPVLAACQLALCVVYARLLVVQALPLALCAPSAAPLLPRSTAANADVRRPSSDNDSSSRGLSVALLQPPLFARLCGPFRQALALLAGKQ